VDAASHCEALLRRRDEDRWLAARYAPPVLRRRLIALYAFHSELRLIPSRVSEPPLGEIRVQWHRDAIAEIRGGKPPRAHPIVEEIAAAGLGDDALAPWIDAAVDAAARPLYGEGYSDDEDFFQWLSESDGAVDAAAVALCGGDQGLAMTAKEAGAAFAAAREGGVLAPDLDYKSRAGEIWRKVRPLLAKAPEDCAPALAHLFLTPLYLSKAPRAFPLLKRIRIFTAAAFGR